MVKLAGVAGAALEVEEAAEEAEEAERLTAEEAACAERKDREALAGVVIGLPPSSACADWMADTDPHNASTVDVTARVRRLELDISDSPFGGRHGTRYACRGGIGIPPVIAR